MKIVFATGTDFDTISVSVQDLPLKESRLMRQRIPGPFPASIQTLLKNKVNKALAFRPIPNEIDKIVLIYLCGCISRYGTPSYFIFPSGWPWILSCNACQIVYFHFPKEKRRFFVAILQMRDVIVIYITDIALMAWNIQKILWLIDRIMTLMA